MSTINRRKMLTVLGTAPAAAVVVGLTPEPASAQTTVPAPTGAAGRRFFTDHEFATVVLLSDMILPKDDRSGSASDSGAPQFIDYIVAEQPARQTPMRGGLVWLDTECRSRFDKTFVECSDAERRQVLDDIAWPAKARPDMSHGVRFFSTLRDLVAAGFWSSRMGVQDLGYSGNRPNVWTGPPRDVLDRLGL